MRTFSSFERGAVATLPYSVALAVTYALVKGAKIGAYRERLRLGFYKHEAFVSLYDVPDDPMVHDALRDTGFKKVDDLKERPRRWAYEQPD